MTKKTEAELVWDAVEDAMTTLANAIARLGERAVERDKAVAERDAANDAYFKVYEDLDETRETLSKLHDERDKLHNDLADALTARDAARGELDVLVKGVAELHAALAKRGESNVRI